MSNRLDMFDRTVNLDSAVNDDGIMVIDKNFPGIEYDEGQKNYVIRGSLSSDVDVKIDLGSDFVNKLYIQGGIEVKGDLFYEDYCSASINTIGDVKVSGSLDMGNKDLLSRDGGVSVGSIDCGRVYAQKDIISENYINSSGYLCSYEGRIDAGSFIKTENIEAVGVSAGKKDDHCSEPYMIECKHVIEVEEEGIYSEGPVIADEIFTEGDLVVKGDLEAYGPRGLPVTVKGDVSVDGSFGGSRITADGDVFIKGDLVVREDVSANDIYVDGNLSSGLSIRSDENIFVKGEIKGGPITAGESIYAEKDIVSSGNILALGYIKAEGHLSAESCIGSGGKITAHGDISAGFSVEARESIEARGDINARANIISMNSYIKAEGIIDSGMETKAEGLIANHFDFDTDTLVIDKNYRGLERIDEYGLSIDEGDKKSEEIAFEKYTLGEIRYDGNIRIDLDKRLDCELIRCGGNLDVSGDIGIIKHASVGGDMTCRGNIISVLDYSGEFYTEKILCRGDLSARSFLSGNDSFLLGHDPDFTVRSRGNIEVECSICKEADVQAGKDILCKGAIKAHWLESKGDIISGCEIETPEENITAGGDIIIDYDLEMEELDQTDDFEQVEIQYDIDYEEEGLDEEAEALYDTVNEDEELNEDDFDNSGDDWGGDW